MTTEFGDFGEFGQADDTTEEFGGSSGFKETELEPAAGFIVTQIEEILGPLWSSDDLDEALTDEDVPRSSRALYQSLFHISPPSAHPPNWVRSRIRRQHLISLGIPVNLDEVLPHAGIKPLPALHITTRPMSAPPVPRNGVQPLNGRASSNTSRNTSRAGTPVPGATAPGNARRDQLSLLPLASLEAYLSDLRTQTQNTSALLTYLLQTKDALQQDSETYNRLIAELVGEAQKMKNVGSRTPSRRGSGMV
ncbi:hypothetical protein EDB83DRAFT_2348962 [Lactarius deliciosus]|nr:hypothetical protein EDB83DRAFT_2348962 [Lactarius deliciosus]